MVIFIFQESLKNKVLLLLGDESLNEETEIAENELNLFQDLDLLILG